MFTLSKQVLAVTAIAAAGVLSAGAAFAQEATPDTWMQNADGNKTRAEVITELSAARQSGLTEAWSDGYLAPADSQRVRAEVRAQTLRAIASGEVQAINARVYDFTPTGSVRVSMATR